MRNISRNPGLSYKSCRRALTTALALIIMLLPLILTTPSVQAQTFTVLYSLP